MVVRFSSAGDSAVTQVSRCRVLAIRGPCQVQPLPGLQGRSLTIKETGYTAIQAKGRPEPHDVRACTHAVCYIALKASANLTLLYFVAA